MHADLRTARLANYRLFVNALSDGLWGARVLDPDGHPLILPTLEIPFNSESEAQWYAEIEARLHAEERGTPLPLDVNPKWEPAQRF